MATKAIDKVSTIEGDETDVLLSELSRQIPGRPHYQTMWRWATCGARSKSGRNVKLATVKLTSGLGSSIQKWREFVDLLQH